MEELNEKLQEPVKDELTERITARLAERQRKLERMQEMQRPARRINFIGGAIALVAAACIAALVVVAPWKNVSPVDELGITPDLTEYRSAAPEIAEIQRLMEKPDYTAALVKAEKALLRSDKELKVMDGVGFELDDEELEYEEQLDRAMNSELRWTYIYLLVKAERNKDAIKELNIYIKNKEYCEHPVEAKQLLAKLKKEK